MMRHLMPRWPNLFSLIDEEDEGVISESSSHTGLSVWEDEKNIHVEAAVPGVNPESVEVTFDKGGLWIKAQKEETEEDKKRKYYRRASQSFSYRVMVPGAVDETKHPEAVCKDGVVRVTFPKAQKPEPKKITIRHG